jgi:hypothetical protein
MLSRLKTLLPMQGQPTGCGSLQAWQEFEATFGYALPTDYKDFLYEYGEGSVNDYLHVYSPFSDRLNPPSFPRCAIEQVANYAYLQEKHPKNYPGVLWPSHGGMLPWGLTDGGNPIFWLTEGHPDQWRVCVLNIYTPAHIETYPMNMTQFLVAVLGEGLTCPVLPEGFVFEPNYYLSIDPEGKNRIQSIQPTQG